MNSAMSLITSPVKSLTGAVQGLGAAFSRVGQSLTGDKRSQSEDSKIKDAIGFSTAKRQYASQFDVDVYSDNQKLQDMLNKISWAGYAGSLTWSAAMSAVPGGAGVAMTVIGTNKVLNQVFQTTPPVELRQQNLQKLNAMGVNPQVSRHVYQQLGFFAPGADPFCSRPRRDERRSRPRRTWSGCLCPAKTQR